MRIENVQSAGIALALAVCVATTACKGKEQAMAGAESTMATVKQAASSTVAGAESAATAVAKPAALTDANIFALLDEANAADSSLAAAALPKLKDPDARRFAKLMEGEHHALRLQTDALAKKLNVTMALPTDDPLPAAAKGETDALAGKTGLDFDRTYIDQEVGIHKAVIDLAGKWHDAAQSTDLKTLIEKAGPVLKAHLDKAEAAQKKLAPKA